MKRGIYVPFSLCAAALFTLCAGCAAPRITKPATGSNQKQLPASFVEPVTGAVFVRIPAGSFMMGSAEDEEGRDPDEGPRHSVSISEFYLSACEVTQDQWDQVMGHTPSHFRGSRRLPVENISWNDTREFLKKLNRKSAVIFRLPTEAEWEYACRAGTDTPFFCGSDNRSLVEYAWFSLNAGGETHPVGTRLPNAWGLYDMHGNVSEWVGDGRRGYLSRPVSDPRGPEGSTHAIHRGGAWLYPARLCRSANRMSYAKDMGTHIIGFRLAVDAAQVAGLKEEAAR